jgi:hypothetical protein
MQLLKYPVDTESISSDPLFAVKEFGPEEHLKFLERYDTLYADYIRDKRREMELKKESQVKRTGYI